MHEQPYGKLVSVSEQQGEMQQPWAVLVTTVTGERSNNHE